MEKNSHAECGAHCKKSNPNSPEPPRKEKKAEMKNFILAGGQDAHDNLLISSGNAGEQALCTSSGNAGEQGT